MGLCSPDDVFTLALAAPAFVSRARPVAPADVDGPSGVIRLRAHGMSDDDALTFEVTPGGSLPTGVSSFQPYAPTVLSFDLFHVGIPSFASVGSGWGIAVDPLRRIARIAEEVSAQIIQHLTAHGVPIPVPPAGYPLVLVGLAARMTARAAVNSLQVENPVYRASVDRLLAQEEFDRLMLEEFRKGWPLSPSPTDATDEADNGARIVPVPAWDDPDWMGRLP